MGQDIAGVVRRALTDKSFKAQLLADANTALASVGIKVPAGLTIKVVEDTQAVRHYVLPTLPVQGELSDEYLEAVSGGVGAQQHVALRKKD